MVGHSPGAPLGVRLAMGLEGSHRAGGPGVTDTGSGQKEVMGSAKGRDLDALRPRHLGVFSG